MSNFGGDAITRREMTELERPSGNPIGGLRSRRAAHQLGQEALPGAPGAGQQRLTNGHAGGPRILYFVLGVAVGALGWSILGPALKRKVGI